MRFVSTSPAVVAALLLAACAGGSRPKGSVKTGHDQVDEFLRRTQALLARIERAEEAAQHLRSLPPGVRIRIDGEGPGAVVDVGGDAEPAVLLRVFAAAEDLAAAPTQMDAVAAEAERLRHDAKRLAVAPFGVPGAGGFRLRQAYSEAMRLLGQLPQRARLAATDARALLGGFG